MEPIGVLPINIFICGSLGEIYFIHGVVASRGVTLVVVVVVDGVGLLALIVDRGYGLGFVVVGGTYA